MHRNCILQQHTFIKVPLLFLLAASAASWQFQTRSASSQGTFKLPGIHPKTQPQYNPATIY